MLRFPLDIYFIYVYCNMYFRLLWGRGDLHLPKEKQNYCWIYLFRIVCYKLSAKLQLSIFVRALYVTSLVHQWFYFLTFFRMEGVAVLLFLLLLVVVLFVCCCCCWVVVVFLALFYCGLLLPMEFWSVLAVVDQLFNWTGISKISFDLGASFDVVPCRAI